MIKFRYFLCFIRLALSLSPSIQLSSYLSVCLSLFSLFILPHEKCQAQNTNNSQTYRANTQLYVGYKNKAACSTFIVSYFHCEIIRFIGFYNVYIVHYNSFSFVHCVLEVFSASVSLSLSLHISKWLWLMHRSRGETERMRKIDWQRNKWSGIMCFSLSVTVCVWFVNCCS